MREKLTKNLGIKLLSLLLAFVVWVIIINIDDPTISRTYPNIPIELRNTEAIDSLGKVYEIAEGNAVSVTVTGKRSVLDKMRSADLTATADLKQMSAFNLIEVEVGCEKYAYENLTFAAKPKMLTVSLEDKGTSQLKVNVDSTGSVDDNYYVSGMEAKPAMIEVSGAESVIARIADIRVSVQLNDETESFKKTDLTPKAYDADGKEIDSSKLEFSHTSVSVKVNIQKTKTVPIEVETKGSPMSGFSVMQVDFDPSELKIAGEEGMLNTIRAIPVEIDVSNATSTIEREIDLTEYLPEGVSIVGDVTSMAVRVTIERLMSRDLTFRSSDIDVRNVPEGMAFSYTDPDRVYRVTVMGLEEDLESLTADQLGAYVDLGSLSAGNHLLIVKFQADERYLISSNPTTSVELKEIGSEGEPSGEEPGDASPDDAEEPGGASGEGSSSSENDAASEEPSGEEPSGEEPDAQEEPSAGEPDSEDGKDAQDAQEGAAAE